MKTDRKQQLKKQTKIYIKNNIDIDKMINKAVNSGCIDIDKFTNGDFMYSKAIAYAIFKTLQHEFTPLKRETKEEAENIYTFL